MAPAALLSDVGGFNFGDIDINDCEIPAPDLGYSRHRLPDHMKFLLDDDDDDGEDNDNCIEIVDDSSDQFAAYLLYDRYRWELIGSHLTRQFYQYSAPPYFKRDHPDDDLFLKHLGDTQLPWRSQLKYPKHADEHLIKEVVAFLIWEDTKHDIFWDNLREMSPLDRDDSLYSHVIRSAAFLVYFLHTQANLFKIGRERTLETQMDKLFTAAKGWATKGTPIDEACELLSDLTADKDEFSFVTENDLADMLCYYAIDVHYNNFHRPPTVRDPFPPTDKDQLLEDITRVFRKVELSPTELKADEYTHWIMMLLREKVAQVEEKLVSQAIGDNPMVKLARSSEDNNPMIKRDRPSEHTFMDDLFTFLVRLLIKAKDRMKRELVNVVQPLNELCKLHGCEICPEISETIQVADIRRMSLGSRFISRSHLIWAFYKLGYALPLEIRNVMINVLDSDSVSDKDPPPYHIYEVALQLTLLSGEKMMQLDHFIYAIIHSRYMYCFGRPRQMYRNDRMPVTEVYQDFKDFQKELESMETEAEPKSTVTVRPCGSLDVFSVLSDDSLDTQERTTDYVPSSSESSSTVTALTGGAEKSII